MTTIIILIMIIIIITIYITIISITPFVFIILFFTSAHKKKTLRVVNCLIILLFGFSP